MIDNCKTRKREYKLSKPLPRRLQKKRKLRINKTVRKRSPRGQPTIDGGSFASYHDLSCSDANSLEAFGGCFVMNQIGTEIRPQFWSTTRQSSTKEQKNETWESYYVFYGFLCTAWNITRIVCQIVFGYVCSSCGPGRRSAVDAWRSLFLRAFLNSKLFEKQCIDLRNALTKKMLLRRKNNIYIYIYIL